jgi:hypothetical protein
VNVAGVVDDRFTAQPPPQALKKETVREVGTPQGAVPDAGFRQAGVQIEHPDKSWPLSGPVGNRQN